MPDFARWSGGPIVRLGPMDYTVIPEVIEWLHQEHGGHYHWDGTMGVGVAGYRGGKFRVKPLGVEKGMYMLDVLLEDNVAAMTCWLHWA